MGSRRQPNYEPIKGYRIIEPLGSGGFGEVWKCEAPGGLYKAIKFVFGNLNSPDQDAARAEQELNALNRIKEVRHPFVLSMERIEVLDGELLIVMELADRNLHDAYKEAQAAGLIGIPRNELLRYVRDSAEALDYVCEKHGLQHLDVKPRNLFLVVDRVKVGDFGLVKHLERSNQSGLLCGVTPLYASPETFSGKISDRSDQYSLAIVYQELLTSHRPFTAKNARALAQQHLTGVPDLRSLPAVERPVVARALAKDPLQRFPNCLAFVRALYAARAPIQISTELPNEAAPQSKSIADTLEDVHLVEHEQNAALAVAEEDLDDIVALGEEPELALAEGQDEKCELISNQGVINRHPETGVLRPTLILAVGEVGRDVLIELRCRLLDRFGDARQAPAIRCLYADTDADAIKSALAGSPEVALDKSEVYHLGLQPISHYRRRRLEHLKDWLPREKVYAMPRSLQTHGSRALGRLAFCDHYARFMSRLKREIQHATSPDVLYQSVSQTGLAMRDRVPRVVVVGSASGGSSGFLLDLGYSVRRLLRQLNHSEEQLLAFLYCGSPHDPATPAHERANLYATLTEWNHFSEGVTAFTAEYGPQGPQIQDDGQAFDATYLVCQRDRAPQEKQDALSHVSNYLFHELTTPLGRPLDQSRSDDGPKETPFRSFGTRGVWFPRGLLLQTAARQVLGELLEEWAASSDTGARITDSQVREVEAGCARILADSRLKEESLLASLQAQATAGLDGRSPDAALKDLLTQLENRCLSESLEAPDELALEALARVHDWLGGATRFAESTLLTTTERASRLSRALEQATNELIRQWDKRLTGSALELMSAPGSRAITGDLALQRLIRWSEGAAQQQEQRRQQSAASVDQACRKLQEALDNCATRNSSFRWLIGQSSRPLRTFLDYLTVVARASLAECEIRALHRFYTSLHQKLQDHCRDVALVRQRLRQLKELLDTSSELFSSATLASARQSLASCKVGARSSRNGESRSIVSAEDYWERIRRSRTLLTVLPQRGDNLEGAATRFVATLTQEHRRFLDQILQEDVLGPRGGFCQACLHVRNARRDLLRPLVRHVAQGLSQCLPVTDVAQVLFERDEQDAGSLTKQIQKCYDRAAPLVTPCWVDATVGQDQHAWSTIHSAWSAQDLEMTQPTQGESPHDEIAFLLIPASEHGTNLGDAAKDVLPNLQVIRVPGQAELTFCREKARLSADELQGLLATCRQAYEDSASAPNESPHSRFDVVDWIPIES